MTAHHAGRRRSNQRLVIRSLLPSQLEAVLALAFGFAATGLNFLFLSVHVGTTDIGAFGSSWEASYTNTIVRPLTVLFKNASFNNFLFICLWGLLGLLVYSLLEAGIRGTKSWHEAKANIQYNYEKTTPHPMLGTVMFVLWWRGAVVLTAIILLVIVYFAAPSFVLHARLLLGQLPATAVSSAVIGSIVAWTLIAHVTVVLIRLFVLRTRVFGEIPS
jgi:hypothetical protein